MNFINYLLEEDIISEGSLEHATRFSNNPVLVVDSKYRSIENSLLLIQTVREETLVSAINAFNRVRTHSCINNFVPTENCFRVLTPQQQEELETAVLRVDTQKKTIVLGFATTNENTKLKVRAILARGFPNFALEETSIFEIPHLRWVKKGFDLLNKSLAPNDRVRFERNELKVTVEERLLTIFRLAIEYRATDISFESNINSMDVYLIIDKTRRLFKNVQFTLTEAPSVVTWIVTKSGIAQNLTTQKVVDCALDGLGTNEDHRGRVNKLVSHYGPTINIRLLPNNSDFIKLVNLNYTPFIFDYMSYLKKPRKGMILILGETNSGKNTTTLSILSEQLIEFSRKIVSLEQPVEYLIPGVQQIPADTDEEYIEIARALVRQSPDTVYLSEIRDKATIETALAISRTGKSVMSTMHVSHAYDVFNRAEDLHGKDISNKLVGELIGVINQVLLPKACSHCLEEQPRQKLKKEYKELLDGAGYGGAIYDNTGKTPDGKDVCPYCEGRKSKGIIPVAEYIHFDDSLKRQLRRSATPSAKEELLMEVMKSKKNSLLQDGLRQMGMKNASFSILIERDIVTEGYNGGMQ